MWKQVLIGGIGALTLASAAAANSPAVTTGDLNIRSGPGTGYAVVGVIPAGHSVSVANCVAGGSWCAVDFAGTHGWSSASYITGAVIGGQAVFASTAPVYRRPIAFASTAPVYRRPLVFASTAPSYAIAPSYDRPYPRGLFDPQSPYRTFAQYPRQNVYYPTYATFGYAGDNGYYPNYATFGFTGHNLRSWNDATFAYTGNGYYSNDATFAYTGSDGYYPDDGSYGYVGNNGYIRGYQLYGQFGVWVP
jgi:uncharacterized protein YraI